MERLSKAAAAGPLADYAIGARVMTREGYPGVIDDILEGPADLTTYFVTLDNEMGGGEYAEAEIQPLKDPTNASRVDASVERTAADDYPELGSILTDRLPPALHTTASQEDDDYWSDVDTPHRRPAQEPGTVPNRASSPPREPGTVPNRASFPPVEPGTIPRYDDSHEPPAWTSEAEEDEDYDDDLNYPIYHHPKQSTNDEARDWNDAGAHEDMEGEGFVDPPYPEDEAQAVAARLALYLPPVPPGEQRSSTTDLTPDQKTGYDEGFRQGQEGITRAPSDPLDEDFMIGFEIGWAEGVTVLREPAFSWDIEDLGKDQTADLPSSVVPSYAPHMMGSLSTEADWSYDWCRFRKNSNCHLPKELNEAASKQAGYAVWVPFDRGTCYRSRWVDQQKCPTGEPGPHVPGGFTDATVPWEEGGQHGGVPSGTQAAKTAAIWREWDGEQEEGTFSSPRHKTGLAYVIQPADDDQPGNFVWVLLSGTSMHQIAMGFTDSLEQAREDAEAVAARGGKEASYNVLDDLGMPYVFDLDKTAAFEVTARWSDIREKAKRIRSEGGVRMVAIQDNVMVAHVKGDHGVYETEIVSFPGKRNAASWSCGCKWSSYSWGRSGPWKKFEGRMCAHALALQYEAQSRGSHGRELTLDEKQPAWMDQKHVHRPGDYSKDKQRYSSITEQVDDEAPPLEMLAHVMMVDGAKYQTVRQALLAQGVERPVDIIKAARATTFWGKVRNRLEKLLLDEDDGVLAPGGAKVPGHEVLYPKWHPTKGLDPNDNTPLRVGSLVAKDEKCTCFCEECWKRRDDCVCPDGPTGGVSGSCPVHGWQVESKSKDQRVSPSEHGDPRMQDAGVSVSKTKDGKYYVHTHRARGKYRDSVSSIPDSEIEYIRSTGAYYTEDDLRAAWEASPEAQAGMTAEQALAQVYHEQEPDLFPAVGSLSTTARENLAAAARALLTMARRNEPDTTLMLSMLALEYGGDMVGLDNRLKSEESLLRKMHERAGEHGGDAGLTAIHISDSLRYTMMFSTSRYTDGVRGVMSDLAGGGYREKVKNYWEKGDPYDGINIAMMTPKGHPFELQFHTPESLKAKDLTHRLYEQWRTNPDPEVREELAKEMIDITDATPVPAGILSVPTLKRQPLSRLGAKTPPSALYHYTSEMHYPYILSSGHLRLTESNIEISGEGPPVVWLTETPTPEGNGVYGFKQAVKITVHTAGLPLHHWPTWAFEQGIDPIWYDALHVASEGGDPETWWVCTKEIPLSACSVEHLGAKQADLLNPGLRFEAKSGVLYHIAPASARQSIEQHGLDYNLSPSKGYRWEKELAEAEDPTYPKGNYFFQAIEGPEQAKFFQSIWSDHWDTPFDIWEADVSGLDVKVDPLFFGQTRYVTEPIPASKLKRIASLTKSADEDQCPFDASDSLMQGGFYVCEEGHAWHPDEPAAKAYHEGPGEIQPLESSQFGQFAEIPALMMGRQAATEYVQVGNEEHAREVTEAKGQVSVNGQPYGTLRRDTQRTTRREWVLTDLNGKETEHPAKGDALYHAGRNHKTSAKKDDGPSVSGVALKAADTGRILMLQRGLEDDSDPAAGTWEFPGGHHEDGDLTSLHAGIREWEEEVGVSFPSGAVVQETWTSPDGVYQGHVVVIPKERDLILTEGRDVDNPDDPDGDASEQVAWWDPDHACKNPALREECKKTPWKILKSAHKEGTKMDISDEFGSLFEGAMAAAPDPGLLPVTAERGDEWGLDLSYEFDTPVWAGPNGPNVTITSGEDTADVIDGNHEESALPVTYGDEEEPDKVAAQLQAALGSSTPTTNSVPGLVGSSHEAGLPLCPKCNHTVGPGDVLEVVPGVGLQHKGPCPSTKSSSAAPAETEAERGKRLLAYADARARGETPEGPDPFAHITSSEQDNELAAAASNYLATKGGLQSEALKSYSAPERQAIIDEGEGEEGASNLDRLDIKGTHYEAMGQMASTASSAVLAQTLNGGVAVPEDEDMTFLAGDPNLGD